MSRTALLAVARGAEPADLVLKEAHLIDVLAGEVRRTEVAIFEGKVAGVGRGYRGKVEVDLGGRFLCPGLVDAHVHVESSLVTPSQFARAVVPRGVTTVVTDPHEIANVCGLDGIRFMLRDAESVPLEIFVNVSSCVPATDLETSGARLAAAQMAELLAEPRVLGLAEVMNFPGVVAGDPDVMAKLDAFAGRVIDGHCPGLSGAELNAYVAAGISSDHECTTVSEAREKLRLGLMIFIREATNARNLEALLPLVDPWTERRICFCTDDRQPSDLLSDGSVDHMVRVAIREGLEPVTALRLATVNAAEHYRLHDRGALVPGRRADFFVFSDLEAPLAEEVYVAGRRVASCGVAEFPVGSNGGESRTIRGTVHADVDVSTFAIPVSGERVRVIGVVENQLRTEALAEPARVVGSEAVADPERDLAKIVVVERHHRTGNVGKAFVRGFGLERGALAGTVAHDHHNLVVVGMDDVAMTTAARAVVETGGGLAAAEGDRVLARLALPIAGLMSDGPIEEVRRAMDALLEAAHGLGSKLHDPFMAMSFLGLEVIPSLKLTDKGLVDVDRFELVPLFLLR